MERIGFLGRGRHKTFDLYKYQDKYYAYSEHTSCIPRDHPYPHIVNTTQIGTTYLWEYCIKIPADNGLPEPLRLDYHIRNQMQMFQAAVECAELGIQPEECQYMLSPYDWKIKQMDLDEHRYNREPDTLKQNLFGALQYVDDQSWAGIMGEMDTIEAVRTYCKAVYARYAVDLPKWTEVGDIRVVVGSLGRLLETYVYPRQKEILEYMKSGPAVKKQRVDV